MILILMIGVTFLMETRFYSAEGQAVPQPPNGREPAIRSVLVDGQGILRWADTGEEAAFFGVNYTPPFAYAYRALGYVHASREDTIHQDVLHMARMGLDALRLHIWDCEVSDREGNLLQNDHLRLLD